MNSVNEKSINFLNNHNTNYVLHNASAGDSDIQIIIGGNTYYFTPEVGLSDDDIVNLKNLVNIGGSSLVETDVTHAMFTNPSNSKYYKYNKETLSVSSITYSIGNQNNYTFKIDVPNAQGNIETKYYKINMVPDNIGNGGRITFENTTSEDISPNKIEINLPNNEKQYLKYNVNPEDYVETFDTRKTSIVSSTDEKLFKDINYSISGSTQGGGLYNNTNRVITNFTGDVIGNSVQSNSKEAQGGGVYNDINRTGNKIYC